MTDLALVMTLLDRDACVSQGGDGTPKALVQLHGNPLFWWATESVRRAGPLRQMVFVVLHEQVASHRIDERIRERYPDATVVARASAPAGPTERAAIGVRALRDPGPFAVHDGDHAFSAIGLHRIARTLAAPRAVAIEGALLGFRAADPAYSYVKLLASGMVASTVDHRAVSPFAIAGCHLFADPAAFLELLERYAPQSRAGTLSLSGVYDLMIREGGRVALEPLRAHVPFGAAEEIELALPDRLAMLQMHAADD